MIKIAAILLTLGLVGSVAVLSIPKNSIPSPSPTPLKQTAPPSLVQSPNPDSQQHLGFFIPSNPVFCQDKVAVDLVLDLSSSFGESAGSGKTRLDYLKESITSLYNGLKDEDVIGAQGYGRDVVDIIPIRYKKDQTDFLNTIQALEPIAGVTYTKTGLEFGLRKTNSAIPSFPADYKWIMILITDGAPDKGQEPALVGAQINSNPSIAKFAIIGIELGSSTKKNTLGKTPEQARQLMLDALKSPKDFYTPEPKDMIGALNKIRRSVCD